MAAEPKLSHSYEAYLALEEEREVKHEYHDGEVFAVAGGTPEHALIGMNIGGELRDKLNQRKDSCLVFSSDARVKVEDLNRALYPDVSVVCGDLIRSESDPNAVTNPILLVEVLSESTADYDRGKKFSFYRQLSSLREYLLVSSTGIYLDSYYRPGPREPWEIQTYGRLSEQLKVKSLLTFR
ncbi:MAG: Uma2 family endonuclease [Bacteroidota bacterium]